MVDEGKLSEVLRDFARTMMTDLSMEAIADRLVKCIVDVLPYTSAGITLTVRDGASRYVSASGDLALRYEQLQIELQDGPSLRSHATGEAVFVVDLDDPRFPRFAAAARASGLRAVSAFPLRHDTDHLGAMALYRSTPGPLDPHATAVAQTLTDVTAAYLIMARARDDARAAAESFRQITLHDPLTGLANRHLLEDRIEHAAERARRSAMSVAILFADLDQFKLVNDACGHEVGDELLIAVARRLSTLIRPNDTVARISGDEFVFLCEDLGSPADVDLVRNRIIEAFSVPFTAGGREFVITASVGVAYAGAGERISTHLVAAADKAMYEAKRVRFVP